ncbi:MAG: RAMP superfamily CRISPR-associated protein [Nitrososphaerota archaeon]|nr:RAMP superfamily CRISPR-associated protein [Nitrososphaerota archaeon]
MPQSRVADFDQFRAVYILEGSLINETPMRIGMGRTEQLGSAADVPHIRIRRGGEEVPYIPGSSLKGAFRSLVERVSAAIYGADSVHPPFDFKRAEAEYLENRICPTCGIFGSTMVASHVAIRDSLPKGSAVIAQKTGIGINRDFGGVQPGAGPFVEEYVPPGVEWTFHMRVTNIALESESEDDPRPELLRFLLSSLIRGEIQVGGRASIGAGVISLRNIRALKRTLNLEGRLVEAEVKLKL